MASKYLMIDFENANFIIKNKESCQRHNYYDIYLSRIFTLHRGSSG
jgi:hypothetical protein